MVFLSNKYFYTLDSVRKFSLNKPPPDVYGWEENNYFNRWAPQILQNDNATVDQQQNSENFSKYVFVCIILIVLFKKKYMC